MWIYFVSIIIALITFAFFYLRRSFQYWDDRQVCNDRPTSIMGNMKGMGTKWHQIDCTDFLYRKFRGKDKYFGMYMMNNPIAIITDLDLCRKILIKDFAYFHDRGMYYNEVDDPLSAHIFSLNGAQWKSMRNKLSPTFTSGKLKSMFSTVTAVSDDLIELVRKKSIAKESLDMKDIASRYTGDAISQCAFGINCNALKDENSEIIVYLRKVFAAKAWMIIVMIFVNTFPKFSKWLGLPLFPPTVTKYFYKLFKETVEIREQNKNDRNDFIGTMTHMMNHGSVADDDNKGVQNVGKITFNELAAQAFVFFFAGFETSSSAVNFCIFELSRNADIQEKVRQEILSVLEKHDGKITYDAVNQMPYLEQVINETLRRFPPVPFQLRITNEDYKVEGTNHTIEKGVQLLIPTYSIQNDETLFPNPEKFDPDRFSPENVRERHPAAFIPFGDGPRICIGSRFAMVQVKVGLVSLISHFKFTVNEKTKLPIRFDPKYPTIALLGGVWVDAEEIKN